MLEKREHYRNIQYMVCNAMQHCCLFLCYGCQSSEIPAKPAATAPRNYASAFNFVLEVTTLKCNQWDFFETEHTLTNLFANHYITHCQQQWRTRRTSMVHTAQWLTPLTQKEDQWSHVTVYDQALLTSVNLYRHFKLIRNCEKIGVFFVLSGCKSYCVNFQCD